MKLLAIAEEIDGEIAVRVHPAMVPVHHPLAAVRDSFNAVFIEGDAVGELMLYGRGAGGNPTASAVLGDLVDAVKNLVSGAKGATIGALVRKPIRPIAELETPFYLLMEAADRPGVLASIAGEFGRHGVSIKSMEQRGIGADARLVFITHRAREADLRATLEALARGRRGAAGRFRRARHRRGRLTWPSAQGWPGPHRGVPRVPAGHRRDAGRHAARGQHAARRGAAHRGAGRGRAGAPEGRGREPDRFVQGPRHDDGRVEGGRARRQGGHLRVDGQHVGVGCRVRDARRDPVRRRAAGRARSRSASSPRRSSTARGSCR